MGKTVLTIPISKEKSDARTATEKGEEARAERVAKQAKATEVNSMGKPPNKLTVA